MLIKYSAPAISSDPINKFTSKWIYKSIFENLKKK